MKAIFYDQLFQLNRCLEQVAEILEFFQQEGLIHSWYADARRRSVEDLRSDLSHLITGSLRQQELEACAGLSENSKVKADG